MKKWVATCTKDFGESFFEVEVEAETYTSAFICIMEKYDESKRNFAIVNINEKAE